jgi:hypothetical protein
MAKETGADPRREAVYEWEDAWYDWGANTCSLTHCRALIATACAHFKVEPPRVKQHNKASLSYCIPTAGIISLQAVGSRPGRGGKNPATALHEAAHYIAHRKYGERIQDHGPTFLGVYMWLLEEAKVAPRVALHASARSHGLRWRKIDN